MWFIRYYILAKIVISAEVITLLRNQSVRCIVTENSTNTGIYINPVIATDFDKQLNNLEWNNDDWNWTDSTKKFFAPVVDERWTTFVTKNSSKYLNLLHVPISISICLNNNSNVAVWNDATFEKFYNKSFFITKINSLPERPSCQWFHYTLTNSRGKLFLNENDNTTLFRPVYERKPLNNLIKFQDFWKMHYYKFRFSNKPSENNNKSSFRLPFSDNPCLSMFVSVDVDCYLNITLEINNTINTEMIIGFNKKGSLKHWKKIEMRVDPSGNGSLSFLRGHLKNYKTGFWAVDNIRFCNKNFETYTTQLPITSSSQYACKELRNSKKSNNPFCKEIGYLGLNCNISCATVLGPSFATCQNYKICSNGDINSCFCSWGYQGSTCSEECNKGYYGIKCDKKCNSNCEDCNHIKGCVKCKANYFGDNCNDMLQYEDSTNTVHMRWKRPLSGNPQHYTLKYECQNYYCPSNNSFIVNTTTTTIKLPYSATCDLELYVQLESKSQILDKITVITRNYTDIDKTELPTNITFVQRSVEMYLKDCTSFNGTISYQLKLRCLSEWCLNATVNSEIFNVPEYISIIKQTFGDLLPFTRYSLTVTINKFGNTINHLYPEFTTPGIPHQVTIYSKNSSTLWIRWLPPDSSMGNNTSYNISYQGADMNSQQNSFWPCKLWKTYLCTTITKLKENMKYTVNIQAKKFGVDEWSRPSNVTAFTNEEESEAPKTIIPHFITSIVPTVNLTWTHPLITNGPLKKFHIQVEEKNYATNYELHISECQEIYDYRFSVEYPKEYNVSVWAENKFQGKKADISLTIMSPIPEISSIPFMEYCSKTSCMLLGPKPSITEVRKFCLVVTKPNKLIEPILFNCTISQNSDYWTVEYETENTNYFLTKIGGTNRTAVSLTNSTHSLYLVAGEKKYLLRYHPEVTENKNSKAIISITATLVLAAVILLTGLIFYAFQKRIKRNTCIQFYPEIRRSASETEMETLVSPPIQIPNFVNSIAINDFENYVFKCLSKKPGASELIEQYQAITSLPQKCSVKSTFGLMSGNTKKNRYVNIVAYDSTRVILQNNDKDGCYINANYIDSYESPKAFIATQAPLPWTLNDFWLMIWQEKVTTIVMLTRLIENNRVKCEQYWPELHSSCKYGDFLIETTLSKEYPSYVRREFKVNHKNETRVVRHLQYTEWPDYGVPLYVENFTVFMKKIIKIPRKSPVVVHCSAGCGRTGTLILCDIILEMARKEQKVDFYKVLTKMRKQRTGLVNSVDQYIFAHQVVCDCLFGKNYSIPLVDDFSDKIEEALAESALTSLTETLNRVTSQYQESKCKSKKSLTDAEKMKNRFPSILPGYSQVYLPVSSSNSSNYINAVTVDCYLLPRRFIMTQLPLQNTINDFWNLIIEYNIKSIISLNEISDEDNYDCPKFCPDGKNQVLSLKDFKDLHFLNKVEYEEYQEITMQIENGETLDPKQTVTLTELKGWKTGSLLPENPDNLIKLWKKVRNTETEIVVTCYDGATASGLLVALAFLLEKIDVERVCDVFSAAKIVRQARPQCVQSVEQLQCLYRLAIKYAENL